MTRDEAIAVLQKIKPTPYRGDDKSTTHILETIALDMAIKSLEPCDNAVSRQAVLDALDKRFDSIPMEQTTEILLLRKDLRELPPVTPQEQGWIPCRERLPKEGGWYICTCYNGAIKTVTFFKWQTRLKQWEKTGTRAYWKIIAWQPLPEPYAGGEEE